MPFSLPEREEVDKIKEDMEKLEAEQENQRRLQDLTDKALAELRAPKPARLKHGELPSPRSGKGL